MWLRDTGKILAEKHRPDRVGLLLTVTSVTPGQSQTILAREIQPGSSKNPNAQELIKYLKQFVPVRIIPAKTIEQATPMTHEKKPVEVKVRTVSPRLSIKPGTTQSA